jgi:hypothetical protein
MRQVRIGRGSPDPVHKEIRMKFLWLKSLLITSTTLLTAACGGVEIDGDIDPGPGYVGGKADGVTDRWELDLTGLASGVKEKVGKDTMEWQGLADGDWRSLFKTKVQLGPGQEFEAGNHLFGHLGVTDRWIPYADQGLMTTTQEGVRFSDGQISTAIRGDEELVTALCKGGEGDIGISLKHVAPEHRVMVPATADKEAMKLYDTHIQLWTCVKDAQGDLRAITLNNPTNYAKSAQALDGSGFSQSKVYGAFGTRAYGNIFLRMNYDKLGSDKETALTRPDGSTVKTWRAFHDNFRTMSVIFNSVSWFPVDYNGNDPLASHDPAGVKQHLAMAIHAVIGTANARGWWLTQKQHFIYCAELAHLAASAALLVPLNADNVVGLSAPAGFPAITTTHWKAFVKEIATHNAYAGKLGPLTTAELKATYIGAKNRLNTGESNSGPFKHFVKGAVSRIKLALSPAALKPFHAYTDMSAVCAQGDSKIDCMAFKPMTMADMVQSFLGVYIPRHTAYGLGDGQQLEALYGGVQAEMLIGMKDGLYEAMGLEGTHPQQVQGRAMLSGIIDKLAASGGVIRSTYASHAAFEQALVSSPDMLAAQAFVSQGPKPTSFFAPPSLYHLVALKRHQAMVGLDYIAHGVHFSLVKPKPVAPTPGPAVPPSVPTTPTPGTTTVPAAIKYGSTCKDKSQSGGADYSMYECVDTSHAQFTGSACNGKTVKYYCPGAAAIRCCVLSQS